MSSKTEEKESVVKKAVINEENARLKLVNLNKQKQITIMKFKKKPNDLTMDEYRIKLEALALKINKAKSDYNKARVEVTRSRQSLARSRRKPLKTK